jgi:hypothetical protein
VSVVDATRIPRDIASLSEEEWQRRAHAHAARVQRWTSPYRARAARGEKHPVFDFLWEYYSLRPSLLERWHPGIGLALAGAQARKFLSWPGYVETDAGVAASPAAFPSSRLEAVRWIRDLLRACEARPAFYGCFGLHEWAMVFRTTTVRHESMPLRFSPDELARIVESLPVRCSHFDAFRFFTPAARPLNRQQPASDTRLELEQRGCVHVTMDLYKWAYKLTPFTPAELVADCFELALAARELDMRASPYDLRHLGYAPVKIETPDGRAEYEREQRALAARAVPLRGRLLDVCAAVLA